MAKIATTLPEAKARAKLSHQRHMLISRIAL
jgi:hypothetical protein